MSRENFKKSGKKKSKFKEYHDEDLSREDLLEIHNINKKSSKRSRKYNSVREKW